MNNFEKKLKRPLIIVLLLWPCPIEHGSSPADPSPPTEFEKPHQGIFLEQKSQILSDPHEISPTTGVVVKY